MCVLLHGQVVSTCACRTKPTIFSTENPVPVQGSGYVSGMLGIFWACWVCLMRIRYVWPGFQDQGIRFIPNWGTFWVCQVCLRILVRNASELDYFQGFRWNEVFIRFHIFHPPHFLFFNLFFLFKSDESKFRDVINWSVCLIMIF